MNTKRWDKIRLDGAEGIKAFRPFADYVIGEEVYNTTAENMAVIAEITSLDMATGAAAVKTKYLVIGGLIGVAIATIVGATVLVIKNKTDKS